MGHNGAPHVFVRRPIHMHDIMSLVKKIRVLSELTYSSKMNNLTLRSDVKVNGGSWWYATHRFKVVHPEPTCQIWTYV